jgi:hypothetical protein
LPLTGSSLSNRWAVPGLIDTHIYLLDFRRADRPVVDVESNSCSVSEGGLELDDYVLVEDFDGGEVVACSSCVAQCGSCGTKGLAASLGSVEHPTTGVTIAGLLVCPDCAQEAESGDASFWDGVFFGDNEDDEEDDDDDYDEDDDEGDGISYDDDPEDFDEWS